MSIILNILSTYSPSSFLMNPLPFYLLSTFLAFLLIKWLSSNTKTQKVRPPSPPKLPIIGNFHQLGSLLHRSFHNLAQKHGPIMSLQLGRISTIVISSSEAAREIMKNHDLTFADRPTSEVVKKLLYNSKDVSVAPYGEFWRQLKSVYTLQLLSNKKVETFRGVREDEVALMVKKIRESSSLSLPVNLSEMFTDLTNDVVSRAAFGKKYGEGENGQKFKQLLTEFLRLLGFFDVGHLIPCLRWINKFNGFDSQVDRVAKEIDEFLEDVVEERLNVLNNNKNDGGESAEDFLDIMLRIYKDDSQGFRIDRDTMKAVILTTFSAGTDTTSTFLEWQMTELLRHPKIMKKVQNEVREILQGKAHINDNDLEKMKYLKATMKETFRLHPPIPLLVAREARENVKIMGYDIDAGTMVVINAWAIGRDPKIWDKPEEFKPERFLNSNIEYRGLDFELIPFGAGRRGCPGISFATAVNELVTANLVQKFDWELPNGIKGDELDMSECPGIAVHRRVPLVAVAEPVKNN